MSATTTATTTSEQPPLDDRIATACGQLNACYAQLVELIAEVIATDAWHGHGIRSLEHWICWRTGLSTAHARTLVALVSARDDHPKVCAAFAAGELSVDQAGLAIHARPAHDDDIAVWAKVMTLPQLRLAVRASTASAPPEPQPQPEDTAAGDAQAGEQSVEPPAPLESREYVSLQPDAEARGPPHGRLDGDRGAILDAALAEARDRLFGEGQREVTWADALVDIAERSLAGAPLERQDRFRVNLFLDPEHSQHAMWTNGISVPDAVSRLCGCDGTISPVFVENGRPVSVGRSQRIVPERTRRIVFHRDKQCRNPLCAATRWLEVHHIVHWIDGGPTDTDNLIALCGRCHRDHHVGRLDIAGDADEPDGVTFRDEHGPVIDPATHAEKPTGPPPEPAQPYRHPLGERLQRWAIAFNPTRPVAN